MSFLVQEIIIQTITKLKTELLASEWEAVQDKLLRLLMDPDQGSITTLLKEEEEFQ